MPVLLAMASTTSGVDVQNCKTSACEILCLQTQYIVGGCCWTTMSFHQQWRQTSGGTFKVTVLCIPENRIAVKMMLLVMIRTYVGNANINDP